MRLSTSMLYEQGMRGIQRPQAEQLELQQKISSGRRVLKPSDDPIAAAAVIGLQQSKAVNTHYSVNAQSAASALNLELEALGDATRVLQDIKELVVKSGNPVLQDSDRRSIATEVQGLYDELLGIANRTDGDGKYMFAGFHTRTQPFAEASPGSVTYSGDDEQRFHVLEHARDVGKCIHFERKHRLRVLGVRRVLLVHRFRLIQPDHRGGRDRIVRGLRYAPSRRNLLLELELLGLRALHAPHAQLVHHRSGKSHD